MGYMGIIFQYTQSHILSTSGGLLGGGGGAGLLIAHLVFFAARLLGKQAKIHVVGPFMSPAIR